MTILSLSYSRIQMKIFAAHRKWLIIHVEKSLHWFSFDIDNRVWTFLSYKMAVIYVPHRGFKVIKWHGIYTAACLELVYIHLLIFIRVRQSLFRYLHQSPGLLTSSSGPLLPYGCCLVCLYICQLKKNVQLESCELSFIWGQNEDCISERSERLLPSGSGRRSIYKVLVKREFNIMKHSFYKKVFVSHKNLISTMKGFSASLGMRRCKDWDNKICS